ncbi:unnamed protein product [Amoebophrya sp. A25]|nr:unnamed protein product [Amoebophrya sp. A25]|eukprot:GSA25T00023717001.1
MSDHPEDQAFGKTPKTGFLDGLAPVGGGGDALVPEKSIEVSGMMRRDMNVDPLAPGFGFGDVPETGFLDGDGLSASDAFVAKRDSQADIEALRLQANPFVAAGFRGAAEADVGELLAPRRDADEELLGTAQALDAYAAQLRERSIREKMETKIAADKIAREKAKAEEKRQAEQRVRDEQQRRAQEEERQRREVQEAQEAFEREQRELEAAQDAALQAQREQAQREQARRKQEEAAGARRDSAAERAGDVDDTEMQSRGGQEEPARMSKSKGVDVSTPARRRWQLIREKFLKNAPKPDYAKQQAKGANFMQQLKGAYKGMLKGKGKAATPAQQQQAVPSQGYEHDDDDDGSIMLSANSGMQSMRSGVGGGGKSLAEHFAMKSMMNDEEPKSTGSKQRAAARAVRGLDLDGLIPDSVYWQTRLANAESLVVFSLDNETADDFLYWDAFYRLLAVSIIPPLMLVTWIFILFFISTETKYRVRRIAVAEDGVHYQLPREGELKDDFMLPWSQMAEVTIVDEESDCTEVVIQRKEDPGGFNSIHIFGLEDPQEFANLLMNQGGDQEEEY